SRAPSVRRTSAPDGARNPVRGRPHCATHPGAVGVMTWLLKPAELLYRGINRLRRALYRAGVLRPKRLPIPVISVGNIAIGGGGKTPAVIAIARACVSRDLRVVVLTRGYGRAGEGGEGTWLDGSRFGVEAVLMKK